MASNDLPRVKRNVAKMVGMGAPEADIDAYIASEGTTVDEIKSFKPPAAATPAAAAEPVNTVGGVANQVLTGVVKGIPNAIDAAGALVATGAEKLTGGDRTFSDFMQGGGVLNAGMDKVLGTKDPVARTNLERYARAAGEGLSSAFIGGPGGSTVAQIAKTGIKGATSGIGAMAGGDVGEKVAGDKGRIVGSLVGGVAGAYAPSAAKNTLTAAKDSYKNIAAGFGRKSAEEWQQVGNAMADEAKTTLDAANKTGTVISKAAATKGIDKIVSEIEAEGDLKGSAAQKLYGDTIAVLDDLKTYKKGELTLDKIHQVRQTIGQMISRNYKRPEGAADAAKATSLMNKFDDWVEGLTDKDLKAGSTDNVKSLYDYLGQYSQFKRFDDFRKLVESADGDVNKIRTTVRGWFKPGNEKKLRGFTPEQVKVIRAVAYPTQGEGLLNTIGKAGIDVTDLKNNGFLGPFLNIVLAGSHGVSTGGASVVGASLAKMAGKGIGAGKVESALRTLSAK